MHCGSWLQINLVIDRFSSLQYNCGELIWAEPRTGCHVFIANNSVDEMVTYRSTVESCGFPLPEILPLCSVAAETDFRGKSQ